MFLEDVLTDTLAFCFYVFLFTTYVCMRNTGYHCNVCEQVIYLFASLCKFLHLLPVVRLTSRHSASCHLQKLDKEKKLRADLGKNQDHRERNWTDFEVELFCSILSDPEYKYALTLQ